MHDTGTILASKVTKGQSNGEYVNFGGQKETTCTSQMSWSSHIQLKQKLASSYEHIIHEPGMIPLIKVNKGQRRGQKIHLRIKVHILQLS